MRGKLECRAISQNPYKRYTYFTYNAVRSFCSLLINIAPDKFDDGVSNNWGTTKLSSSRIYGPVLAKSSTGTWSGIKLYIEVWPIKNAAGTGTEYVVEASSKTTSQSTASTKHDELITFLQNKGWFLTQDSLKTQLIMDRY
ncbi:hypothetical protein ABE504_19165 [Paenibacillus oryzisoli]|uniref:hypothetical protein n=1 Tax=Paenibacillus oryzisoli TaxID=1850517 RepID=UPI003D2AA77C